MKNKIVKTLFSVSLIFISVILFFLAHPNPIFKNGIGFLGWIYFFPIAVCVRQNNYKNLSFLGFFYGFFAYLFYGYWLFYYGIVFLFVVSVYYGLLWSIVFLILKLIANKFGNCSWFIQSISVTVFEYIKTKGFTGFSYGITGYTQWKSTWLIQIADITGVYGVSFILILTSFLLENFVHKIIQNKDYFLTGKKINFKHSKINKSAVLNKFLLGLYFSYFIFIIAYGKIITNKTRATKTIGIVAIQSNDDPWAVGIENYRKNIQELIYLTDEALEFYEDTKIVVWPETAVVPSVMNYYYPKDERRNRLIVSLMKYINSKDCSFVIGNAYSQLTDDKDFNSALYFEEGRNILPPQPEIYSKIKLVPFSESFPYEKIFPGIYNSLIKSGNHFWTPGKDIKLFNYKNFIFGTPICFEDTFSEIPRKMRLNGAQCLINLSNDSWSNSVSCQKQHLSMAVFRAAENKIPEIRSTATGQTCYINMFGKVEEETIPFSRNFLYCKTEYSDSVKLTIYTKYGDIFMWVLSFTFVILLLKQMFIAIIKK